MHLKERNDSKKIPLEMASIKNDESVNKPVTNIETKASQNHNKNASSNNTYIFTVIVGVVFFSFLYITLQFFRWKFSMNNVSFTKRMVSSEIKELKKEFSTQTNVTSIVLLNSCTIKNEPSLIIFPLLDDLHSILVRNTIVSSTVKDRIYYRDKYFKTILSYLKHKKSCRYIPYVNVRNIDPFNLSIFTISFRNYYTNRHSFLTSAITFVDRIFNKNTFLQHNETFLFCALFDYYVEVIKYDFTNGNRFIVDRSFSFYFEKQLATECFFSVLNTLSNKINVRQIDEMAKNMDNGCVKM